MAENPDLKDPQHGVIAPAGGEIRFVEREASVPVPGQPEDVVQVKKLRILQRYEWSYVDSKWGWYDVPLMEEE